MCGIIGAVGQLYKKEKEALTNMFLVNATRGIHGCGVLYLYKQTSHKKTERWFNTATTTKHSAEWVFTKEYDEHISTFGMKAFIGHSRWATVGKVDKKNNHPFTFKKVIGFQNGTIRGSFPHSSEYETDTQAFFSNVNEKGLKQAIEEVHEKSTDMAFTFAMYDRDLSEVQLIRNKERPLSIAKTKDTVFFASDAQHLAFGLRTAGFKDDEFEIMNLEPFTLLRLPVWSEDIIKDMVFEKDYVSLKSRFHNIYRYNDKNKNWYETLYGKDDNDDPNSKLSDKYNYGNYQETNKRGFQQAISNSGNYTPVVNDKPSKRQMWRIGQREFGEVFLNDLLNKGCAVCGNPSHYIHKVRFNNENKQSLEFYCDDCKDSLEGFNIDWEQQLVAKPV